MSAQTPNSMPFFIENECITKLISETRFTLLQVWQVKDFLNRVNWIPSWFSNQQTLQMKYEKVLTLLTRSCYNLVPRGDRSRSAIFFPASLARS